MAKEKTSDKPATRLSWGEIAAIGVIVALVVFAFRDFLAECVGYAATIEGGMNRGARFFRDLMVALAAVIGITIAARRTSALDRQSKTSEKRLLNERFATAAELMAKEFAGKVPGVTVIVNDKTENAEKKEEETGAFQPRHATAARISGIYAMGELAIQAPKDFAEQVVKSLIAYIKDNATETAKKPSQTEPEDLPDELRREWFMLGEDVKSAFAVLFRILNDKRAKAEIDGDILDFSYQNFMKLDFSKTQVNIGHYKNWAGTNFRGALFIDAVFHKGVLLENADFYNAVLGGAKLIEADLSYATLQRAKLRRADLRGADMRHAHWGGAFLEEAKMHGSILSDSYGQELENYYYYDEGKSNLRGANLQGAELESAKLRGSNMRRVDLRGAYLHGADLRGADLSGAKFGATDMTGVMIDSDSLTGSVKKAMDGNIWYAPDDEWAQGIAENAHNPTWDLELYGDDYAIVGIVRNFAGKIDSKFGGENLQRQARILLDGGKLSPECAAKMRGYLEKT